MPDADDLAWRFVRGDPDAFEALHRQYAADVRRWILRVLRNPAAADDAVVETFWRAYRARAHFDPARPFGAWIRRIAANAALDELRKARRRASREVAMNREELPDAAPHPSAGAGRSAVAGAVARLPPMLQVVVRLAIIEGEPQAEIAAALGIPVGTVKSRLFRAQRLLKHELAKLGITS